MSHSNIEEIKNQFFMTHVRPVCVIGVLEYRYKNHNFCSCKLINEEILDYYGIGRFFKTNAIVEGEKDKANQSLGIFSLYSNKIIGNDTDNILSMEMIYGIEIDVISIMNGDIDAVYEKELAEIKMNNFINFMYSHYNLELDSPAEIMSLDIKYPEHNSLYKYVNNYLKKDKCEFSNKNIYGIEISPMDLHDTECNIEIKLVKSECMYKKPNTNSIMYNFSKDIHREFCLYIAKAGFKLNISTIVEPSNSGLSDDIMLENCVIYFNIYTSKNIKAWIHAMKRKIKKKFHIIESLEYKTKYMYEEKVEHLV